MHHLKYMLPDPKNAVVFAGFDPVGTAVLLVEGATELKMYGKYVPVRAEVLQDSEFSVRSCASDLLDWLAEMAPKPTTVYCTHGEPGPAGRQRSGSSRNWASPRSSQDGRSRRV